jgi:hypothetical protein
MTQREEFEKWFNRDFHPDKTGPYIIDQLFFSWKASRTNLVVELPAELELDLDGDTLKPSYQNAYVKGYNEALRDVEIKIEQAGITVK